MRRRGRRRPPRQQPITSEVSRKPTIAPTPMLVMAAPGVPNRRRSRPATIVPKMISGTNAPSRSLPASTLCRGMPAGVGSASPSMRFITASTPALMPPAKSPRAKAGPISSRVMRVAVTSGIAPSSARATLIQTLRSCGATAINTPSPTSRRPIFQASPTRLVKSEMGSGCVDGTVMTAICEPRSRSNAINLSRSACSASGESTLARSVTGAAGGIASRPSGSRGSSPAGCEGAGGEGAGCEGAGVAFGCAGGAADVAGGDPPGKIPLGRSGDCCAPAGAMSASVSAAARAIRCIGRPAGGRTYFFVVPKSTVGGLLIVVSFSTANCALGL